MKISSIQELEKIANNIKKILSLGDTIFLYGEIGVGKTTFARFLINSFENEKKLKILISCQMQNLNLVVKKSHAI